MAKVPGGQFNRIRLGIAVIEQGRRSVDSKMMAQSLSIQVLAGQSDALPLFDFTQKSRGVENIAGQVQGRAVLEVGSNAEAMGARAKLIDGIP